MGTLILVEKDEIKFSLCPSYEVKGAHIAFGEDPVSVGISDTIRVCIAFCLLANL